MSANWFSNGVHFECTKCGGCCTIDPERERHVGISANYKERTAIAGHLKMSLKEFDAKYTKLVYEHGMGWRSLAFVFHEQHGFYACAFYNVETKLCTIHPVRPTQCAAFPFWKTLLESREAWDSSTQGGASAFACEGINHGPLITEDEIMRKLRSREGKAFDRAAAARNG